MMAFPDDALDIRPELLLNGTWNDVSAYNDHGPVTIARGHPDESVTVTASTLALTLTNNDARFTSKNPVGPYYGQLVRNVQCRVSVPAQSNYLRLEQDAVSYVTCPDAAGLHVTGDLDLRLDFWPSSWVTTAGTGCTLASKSFPAGTHAWVLQLLGDGTVRFFWSPDGSALPSAVSTASIPAGRFVLRVTLAVASGTVTFYAGTSVSGPWTQLGAAVSTGTATSIFASTAPVTVGDSTSSVFGRVYELQVRNGIGGTLAADPVFSAQAAGTGSFTDAQGNTWSLADSAEISAREYRIHAEVPEWPQHQDASGNSWTTAVSGGGLLRRLGQGSKPVSSTMYRAWTRAAAGSAVAAYWPMEDGASSSRFASASGGTAMYFGGSALPQLASSSAFACSNALPVLNGAAFGGSVSYAGTWTANQVTFLLDVPAAGELNGSAVMAVATDGTMATLLLSYWTGGGLSLAGLSASGAQLFTSGTIAFHVDGRQLMVTFSVAPNGGGGLNWVLQTMAPGAAVASSSTGSVAASSLGAVTRVTFNPYGSQGLLATAVGHCAVQAAATNPFALGGALAAYAGETAGIRFQRLCAEEGIQFRGRGNLAATPLMGVQSAQTLTALLQECADADRGEWYELRQQLGFGYTTRSALYNQAATVTVDYAQDHLGMWSSDPREDDQATVNDVTVTQASGGSSARQYAAPGQPITGGRLSVQAPPNGMGTYDQSYPLNLYGADDLDGEAGWIEHVGTVDQPRFPGIVLDLANRSLASQYWAILGMDLGDRLVINDPPAQLGPDPVSQLAQQITETMWGKEYSVTVCGIPEQPYQVAVTGSAHADTDGTTLSAGASSTAASLSFATAAGYPLWSTSGGDYPCGVMIAGERITVTAITGGSSPQTATVTRSVNGVVKPQASGAAVNICPPPVAAL